MRHKYDTRGIVLSRSPLGEANALVTLLTEEVGLVRARAQGVRQSGAKLSAALSTFTESEVVLVRGKEGWRVAGAVLEEQWFVRVGEHEARARAARMCGLFLRLAPGETNDTRLFTLIKEFFSTLATVPSEQHELVEILAALHLLALLGFSDMRGVPAAENLFVPESLALVNKNRGDYIARVNHGITASGL